MNYLAEIFIYFGFAAVVLPYCLFLIEKRKKPHWTETLRTLRPENCMTHILDKDKDEDEGLYGRPKTH